MKVIVVFLLWILTHHLAANLYVLCCTHPSLEGVLMTFFYAPAPHCKGLRWFINTSAFELDSLWLFIGLFITSRLLKKQRAE